MYYRCRSCGEEFFTPRIEKTSYESYYGVYSLFPNSTPLELEVCPRCNDDNIEEVQEEDDDD